MSIQNKGKDKKENMREDRRAIDRFFRNRTNFFKRMLHGMENISILMFETKERYGCYIYVRF